MIQKEFILCAAIDYNGVIICGHRHGDCYDTLKSLIGEINPNKIPKQNHQGFLTSKNRYINREDAWVIAKEQNQIFYGLNSHYLGDDILIKELKINKSYKPILISENLY